MAEPISVGTVMAVTAIAKGLTSLGGWMSKKSNKKKARDSRGPDWPNQTRFLILVKFIR